MQYDRNRFEAVVTQFGEVFFVLDSGVEYEVHGAEGYEFVHDGEAVRIEGMKDDEYLNVVFPLDSIEHHYSHAEV